MDEVRIWVAAFVGASQEIAVRDAVTALGYPAVLPTEMVTVRHARQQMLRERPVFPRYVFVGIPPGVSWYPLRAVAGVAGILANGNEPRAVPPKVIGLLRAAIEADAFTRHQSPKFQEGDKVKVRVGVTDVEAMVERVHNTLPAHRIDIVFNLLGKKHRQAIDAKNVRAA